MLVSVIIPAHNCEGRIEEAVESVVHERDAARLEIVIVEDGSTDSTLEVCERLQKKHPDLVKVLRHPKGANKGAGASRNFGIEMSRGELVCFLDADDYWLPGRLDVAPKILAEKPEVDGVYEPVEVVFEETASEADRRATLELFSVRPGRKPEEVLEEVLFGKAWHMGGILLRRRAFDLAGVFPEIRETGEDTHLWIRLAAVCRLVEGEIGKPVAAYRRHGSNTWVPETHPDQFHIYWDLCRWAEENLEDRAKRRAVRERLICSVSGFPVHGVARETARRVRRAAGIARAFPRVLGHWSFYKCLRRILCLHPLWQKLKHRRHR